jgi:hypothetical protein
VIFLAFLIGILILFGVSIIFFKFSLNIFFLVTLYAGLIILVLLIKNNYIEIVSSFIIIGASAGYTFRFDKKFQFFIIITSLVITIISTSNFYYHKYINNTDILNDYRVSLEKIINEGGISEQDKAEFKQRIDETLNILKNIMPFSFFLNSVFSSIFSFIVLKLIFNQRINKDKYYIGGIENFRVKEYFIFLFICAWLVVLLIDRKYTLIYSVGLNTALILTAIYFLQSLGIIKFILRKRSVPFFIFPAVMLILLFLGIEFFLFLVIVLSGLGALDFWLDLRKFNLQKNKIKKMIK